jgi:ribosome-binding factor A
MSIRTERVASLIKEEIGAILTREYSDPAMGFTTVTEVRMTPDLRIARVFFSIFGSPEVQKKTMVMLESERPHIRRLIGSRLRLRFVPELEFRHDTTLDRVERINSLIKSIHQEKRDATDAGE